MNPELRDREIAGQLDLVMAATASSAACLTTFCRGILLSEKFPLWKTLEELPKELRRAADEVDVLAAMLRKQEVEQ